MGNVWTYVGACVQVNKYVIPKPKHVFLIRGNAPKIPIVLIPKIVWMANVCIIAMVKQMPINTVKLLIKQSDLLFALIEPLCSAQSLSCI